MPGENYESEIKDGRNVRCVKCKYCNSVVLNPKTAYFDTFEVFVVSTSLIAFYQLSHSSSYHCLNKENTILPIRKESRFQRFGRCEICLHFKMWDLHTHLMATNI